jgi:hypothetical protein
MEQNEDLSIEAIRGGAPLSEKSFLIPASVLASCFLGVAFLLTRFVGVLRADLKDGGMQWPGIVLVAGLLCSVVIIILLACAALGFVAGTILDAIVRSRRKSRKPAVAH